MTKVDKVGEVIFAHCPKHKRQGFVLISKWFWCPMASCGHSFEYEVAKRLFQAGALSSASSVSGPARMASPAAVRDTRDQEGLHGNGGLHGGDERGEERQYVTGGDN